MTPPPPALKMRIRALPTGLRSGGATCVFDLEGLLNLSLPEYLLAAGTQKVKVLTVRWTRYLEFHNIQQGLGLSTASLIAFLIGALCILFTFATNWIYSERTVLEWQAVQAFRIQALLGAIAAFLAGILLRKRPEAKNQP